MSVSPVFKIFFNNLVDWEILANKEFCNYLFFLQGVSVQWWQAEGLWRRWEAKIYHSMGE